MSGEGYVWMGFVLGGYVRRGLLSVAGEVCNLLWTPSLMSHCRSVHDVA